MERANVEGVYEDRLVPGDEQAALRLLTSALFDDPLSVYLYPDEAVRHRRLPRYLRGILRGSLAAGENFAARNARAELIGLTLWLPADVSHLSLSRVARLLFQIAPLHPSGIEVWRSVFLDAETERRCQQALAGRKAWRLNAMAVDGAHRRRGLGGKMLRRQLAEVVEPSGHPALLITHTAENVSFYRSLGFAVVDEQLLGRRDRALHRWIMLYG